MFHRTTILILSLVRVARGQHPEPMSHEKPSSIDSMV